MIREQLPLALARQVKPDVLKGYAAVLHWNLVGRHNGVTIYHLPDSPLHQVVILDDMTLADYGEAVAAAVQTLAAYERRPAREALERLLLPPSQHPQPPKSALFGLLINMYVLCKKRNWDGQGAAPVDQGTVERAFMLIECLPSRFVFYDNDRVVPAVEPLPDGVILFKWSAADGVVYVYVPPEGKGPVDYYFKVKGCGGKEREERGTIPLPPEDLLDALDIVRKSDIQPVPSKEGAGAMTPPQQLVAPLKAIQDGSCVARCPEWDPCLEALQGLLGRTSIPDGVDAPSELAVRSALAWIVFIMINRLKSPPSCILPDSGPKGGIIMEWTHKERSLDITIDNDGTVQFTQFCSGKVVQMGHLPTFPQECST